MESWINSDFPVETMPPNKEEMINGAVRPMKSLN